MPHDDEGMLAFFRHLFYHRRRHVRVVLFIDGYGHELHPHRRLRIMTPVTAGHKVSYAIAFFDANGNPMLATPTPDAAPTWNEAPSAPGIDTFTVDPSGLTAVVQTNPADAASSDVISVSVAVGGHTFAATDTVQISVAPQVLSSIGLVATVS
jgi:hypothetical protein